MNKVVILILNQFLLAAFAYRTSKSQTKKIIKRADRASLTTIGQTVLLGVFGLVTTTIMTKSINGNVKKIIKEEERQNAIIRK